MRKIVLFTSLIALASMHAQKAGPPSVPLTSAGTAVPVHTEYILGANDTITVFVADLPEEFADKTFRIDTAGDVSLPVIGHLHAAGLTMSALELEAKDHLSHVLKNPDVSMGLASFGSQSVSILGAVNMPGIHQLEGHKNLFQILSLAGGLRSDAGYTVNVSRSLQWGQIPWPGASLDIATQTSVAIIKLKDIIDATNAAANIAIMPEDSISVPKADVVYAVGSVVKPGGFPLNEHESLSALQVVALAEGLLRTASTSKAEILRRNPGSIQRKEIAVNLKELMSGRGTDVQLQADDILFVPVSKGKAAGFRTMDSIIAATTGLAVYGKLGGF